MGKRVTIRLGDDDYERLQKRCQGTGIDASFLIRDALGKYLADNSNAVQQQGKPTNTSLAMPDEAFTMTPPYRGFSGDLRLELRTQILRLLALAHTTANHWPRTPGIRETYSILLEACKPLGIGADGRHDQ